MIDSQTATETERLIQLEQAQIRRLESVREELFYYAAEASRTRKKLEALQKGEETDHERYTDFVQEFY